MAMSVESARGSTIYKRSRGGSYCCVVGCHCSSIKCFGLSFFSFPRPGVSKKQDEWRAALIHAIGRSDKSIPLSAKICSRHFEEECIKKGPSGKLSVLVPGSMPTRWMPEQSFKTSKTARPKPKVREPPIVPVRICYTSFMDMKKDLTHLPPQWIIMKNSEDDVVLGLLSSKTEEVHVKVSFSATTGLQANVSVFQMPAPWLARDIEMVRLKTFLKELGEKTLCTGVTETDLQPLAEIKITDEKYFRHITYVYENGKICSCSCVRATTCLLMVSTAETTCKDCLLVKKTLHERKNRQEAIKPNDPLRGRVIVVRNLNCRLLYLQKKAEARSNTHSFASNNKLSDVSSLKPNHFRKTVRRCGTKTFVINDKCAPFKCDECGARFALEKALNLHKKAHSHKSSLPIESEGQECSVESDRENEDIEKRDKADLMLKSIGFQVDEKTDSYQKEGDHSYSENCETWNRQTSRSEITPDKADLVLKSMVFHVDEKTDCCQKEGDHSYSENCETWNSQSEGSEIKHLPPFHQANHMRTHAQRRGIKMYVVNDLCAPFKCGECGARFALAKALTIHKKVHCNGFSNLIVKGDGQEHSVKNDETQREDAQKRDDETSKESDIKFQETAENINCRSIKQTDSSQKESCPPANEPCIAGDMQTSESEAMCDVFKCAQIEDQLAGSCAYCCAGERCEKCRATFSLSSSLEKHLKTHFVERRFPCLECSAEFSKKKALKNHMARMHAKRKTFSCPECLVTLSTSHSLKNHIRIHTGEKPFQCEICKKLFRDCSALRKHYMRTHRTLSHVCQDCGKSFPFVYDLNQHRIIHTGQKTHTCQECKATFTYARNLALHMKIHTDERSFSCEICQKSFRQSSHLKAHLRTHSKERSFLCEDCGKTFASKDYLVVHYRTHTGERPHKCPSCPASYSQRGCLVHHMRIHTGEMFLCDICQKSFRSLQYLKKHKNIHSGEKFLCQDCGKTFFSKYRLKTHQKIHEGSSDNKHIHMSEQFISA